ncbi:hypothetical protein P171DRAFT_474818 [Karstenula rhodostoma CBS 690.94]|uniref:Mid2 domain-containing protein n=1 Tax=Karstenula rhodostoma CBS 690.94 TaxID=1392251 RepID=A0A9P4PEH2_9PLEO|nr:hypothetical protein P171DRAFT_474818 [Karstenula rhodostoma CBS 690.94]
MGTKFLSGLGATLLCLSSHTSATMDRAARGSRQPRGFDSFDQTSQSNYNASFREPMFRAPAVMEPASAGAGSTNAKVFTRFFRRDSCDDNCKTLSDGGVGICCHTSDGGGWCCGEHDNCGPDLGSCAALEGGGKGRCCTGSDVNGGSWCCGEQNLCGDGVNENYCSWAMETTTVVETGTITETVTDVSTVTEPGDTEWSTVTSTSIKVVTISSADVATEVEFVTQTAPARLAKRLSLPKATSVALSTALHPRIAQERRTLLITGAPLQRRDIITSTITTTSTSYETQTDTDAVTSTELSSVTSTSTSVLVSTLTSVLNAKTTTTITSTITQPAAPTSPDGQDDDNQSSQPSGGATGGGGTTGSGGGSGDGLSTGAIAGIGAGAGVGALVICATIFFLWRRHHEKKNREHIAALATATGQYGSPNPDHTRRPMAGIEPAKYDQMPVHPRERYSDLMPTNGTTSPSPPYAPAGYGYELASSPVPQQFYPRPPSPQTAEYQRGYSTGSYVEMHHSAPVEVSGLHSPRPQPLHHMGGTNSSHMDEWRR